MTKWVLILILIFVSSFVLADKGLIETYKPREVFDLSIHLTNSTGDVSGATCNVQIRTENFSLKLNDVMNEIGGGWHNYTYNTSKVGKYFCRQNCTLGSSFVAETCDFIIGVEDNMIFGMLVVIPLFIALFLLIVSWMLNPEKYWALKLGLILLGFVFIFQAYHYSTVVIIEFFNSPNLINTIGDSTWIYGMSFVALFFIFLITFIYDIFMMFSNKRHKTGEYE